MTFASWLQALIRHLITSFPNVSFFSASLHPVEMAAKGFNLLCRQQPWAADRLAAHAGKTIRICLGGFEASFTISSEGHLAKADDAVVPNVTLHLVPERMGPGGRDSRQAGQEVADFVDIQGEAGLAQVVSDLARDLRPDPEDALARWVGDVAAVRLVSGAGTLLKTVRQATGRLGENVAEYLAHEDPQIVARPDLAQLTAQQQSLALQLDRLGTKTDALYQRLEQLTGTVGQRR